jgi:hypothetical protein
MLFWNIIRFNPFYCMLEVRRSDNARCGQPCFAVLASNGLGPAAAAVLREWGLIARNNCRRRTSCICSNSRTLQLARWNF